MSTDKQIVSRFNEAQDRLVLQASDLSLDTISKMVERKSIDISPQFQRRDRWPVEKQSTLIESFLLNVPVPPVYLMEDDYGTYSVIDGKQRITAINQFIEGRIKLTGLEDFLELEGKYFLGLPRQLRNALEVRPYVRVITLLRQSADDLKYEVFTRLNKGGEPLNPQEIRNVIYRGKFNDLLLELSENTFLRDRLKIRDEKSPAYRSMADVELVLRFFTLREKWQRFSGDYRREMDAFMAMMCSSSESDLRKMKQRFLRAIEGCKVIWGDHAFQRFEAGAWRNQMLAGMYDAQMVAIDLLSDRQLEEAIRSAKSIVGKTKRLFLADTFDESVRRATNTPARVVLRITSINAVLA